MTALRVLATMLLVCACGRSDAENAVPSASKGPQDVAFLPGIRDDLSPYTAPPGTLKHAINVRYGRRGGIFPRAGSVSVSTTSDTSTHSVGTIGWVARVNDIGIVGSNGKAFARDESNARFRFQGAYSTVKPLGKRRGLIGENGNGFNQNAAVAMLSNGASIVAGSDGTDVHYIVEMGGVVSLQGTTPGTKSAVVATSVAFFLVAQNGSSLVAREITPGTVTTVGAGVTVGTLGSSGQHWDVTPATNGTEWYLAHQTSTTNIRLDRFFITTSQANSSITVAAGTCPVSLFANATGLWVGLYENVATVRYAVRNSTTLASVLPVTTIEASANRGPPHFGPWTGASTTAFFVYARTAAVSAPPFSARYGTASSAGSVSSILDAWGAYPISKPDSGQRFWSLMTEYSSAGGLTVEAEHRATLLRVREIASNVPPTIELSSGPFFAYLDVAVNFPTFHHVGSSTDSLLYVVPRAYRSDLALGGVGVMLGYEALEYEREEQSASRSVESLNETIVVSGQPVEVPGRGVSRTVNGNTGADSGAGGALEVGFPHRPRVLSALTSNSTGSLTPSSTYQWVAVYEHVDPLGRRHRSAPSSVFTQTTGASDDTAELTLSTLGVGQQLYAGAVGGSQIIFPRIHVYRTSAGGDTYQRVTPPSGAPVAWDPTDGTVSFVDNIADGNRGEFLYTDGGVKDNALAPSCRVVFATDNRLACALGWDRNVVTVTKVLVPSEPPQFTEDDAFRMFFPEDLEAATFMDGAVVGFSRNAIYIVTGEGPNDQGIGQFSEPRTIVTGIGATSEHVLVTELGILFFNTRGWYLLPRGFGSPVFIGAAVQDTTAPGEYDTPRGCAIHHDGLSRTAHLVMEKAANDFSVLVMDLDVRTPEGMPAWSIDGLGTETAFQAIGPWPDGMMIAETSALNFFDSARSTETDLTNTRGITTLIETTDLRPFGLAGWGRVNSFTLLASDCDGNPTLTLRCTPDEASASGVTGYTQANWTLAATDGAFYRQLACANVSATGWRVRVTVGRTDEMGPALHGLTLELNQETGARRVAASER